MSDAPLISPKQRLQLILAGVVVGLIGLAVLAGLFAMYIDNFNLLRWME